MLIAAPHHRRSARVVAAVSMTLLAVAGVFLLMFLVKPGGVSAHGELQSHLQDLIVEVEWIGVPPCGLQEHGISYEMKGKEAVIGQYDGIEYAELCRDKCLHVPECHLWTWMQSKACQLKAIQQDERPMKRQVAGATSGGLPCRMEQMLSPGTLYCWTLIKPGTYEEGLLADQFSKHLSLFACEESTILSNQVINIAPGLSTEVVDISLDCNSGGEFGTALNLNIFIQAWKRIVELAIFQAHEWTVKGDPDAVFFADRLKGLLPHHPEEAKGVYLNNCKYGMHGPVEVFSRNAVNALNNNWQACQEHFNGVCGGDCEWGEDIFVDQCLMKVAGVRRDDEWSLLVEDHCGSADPGATVVWDTSKCDGTHVAFHPFKDTGSWNQCLSNAWGAAAQDVAYQNQQVPAPR